jgi:hypothetical protein
MNLNSMGGASIQGSSNRTREQIEASGTPDRQFADDMNVTGSDNTGMGIAGNAAMITNMANM